MSYNETFTEEYRPNTLKKIFALVLCAALFFSCFPISVFATQKEANTPKEEVVYISLAADGSVKNIYVVNIFDLDEDGRIVDYGRYESLRNMTTTDGISYSSEKVTIDTTAGKLYYEGKLDTDIMPWKVEIKYYINGTELTGTQAAGQSGDLRISLKITENTEYNGDFFKGYALQTSLSLNTKNCRDIVAPGATLANVGINKQITYTILPGSGIDTEITATVTDFAFDGISINGIKLNLNIDINEDAINEKIGQLTDAVKALDEGAGALKDGMAALQEGSSELLVGLNSIASNNYLLVSGAHAAFSGMCTAAEAMINPKLSEYGLETITLTPENYAEKLTALIEQLSDEGVRALANEKIAQMFEENPDAIYRMILEQLRADELASLTEEEKNAVLDEAMSKLSDQLKAILKEEFFKSPALEQEINAVVAAASVARESIVALKTQLDAYNIFYGGLQTYTSAVDSVAEGMGALNEGVKTLYDGASQLKEGTENFVGKTSTLKSEVREIVDTMLSAALGGNIAVRSFVSDDNENVNAVQFVIKSEAVALEAPPAPPAPAEKPKNFWQKLLALFGIKV